MEQSNNEQNSVIFSISEILRKMSNQVNFLIRNHKLLSQLDVDMLMENTRKLYDTVCSVQCNMDVDSIPMEVEGIENEELEVDETLDIENSDFDDEEDDEVIVNKETDNDENKFENEIEMDFEIDNDEDENDDENHDNDSGIRSYIKMPAQIDDNVNLTINDKLEQPEDKSLASVLQKKAITDIMTAIDLNDRFLFLNELFDSNMEKYNKAIKTLNSFSTLLGAKTYMSELQIELQWDCESEAYKKLDNLVERRFI